MGCAATGTDGGGLPGPPDDLVSPDRPADLEIGTITWVSDGDSVDVATAEGELEIRLLGVNAAESGECFADEPTAYLIAKVKDREVGLQVGGTDQFNRKLASIWSGEELLNLYLVEMGLAIALTPQEGDPHGRLLIAAENDAYGAGVGIWSEDACGSTGARPEIMIDLGKSQIDPPGPDGDNLDEEYIVIVNSTNRSWNLDGWTLRDESSRNRLKFSDGISIEAGAELTISSGCISTPSWCGDTPIWNNSGDMALLLDETGRVIARARY